MSEQDSFLEEMKDMDETLRELGKTQLVRGIGEAIGSNVPMEFFDALKNYTLGQNLNSPDSFSPTRTVEHLLGITDANEMEAAVLLSYASAMALLRKTLLGELEYEERRAARQEATLRLGYMEFARYAQARPRGIRKIIAPGSYTERALDRLGILTRQMDDNLKNNEELRRRISFLALNPPR
jgi:hypothetical protein